jgi:hypothetical protein
VMTIRQGDRVGHDYCIGGSWSWKEGPSRKNQKNQI